MLSLRELAQTAATEIEKERRANFLNRNLFTGRVLVAEGYKGRMVEEIQLIDEISEISEEEIDRFTQTFAPEMTLVGVTILGNRIAKRILSSPFFSGIDSTPRREKIASICDGWVRFNKEVARGESEVVVFDAKGEAPNQQ